MLRRPEGGKPRRRQCDPLAAVENVGYFLKLGPRGGVNVIHVTQVHIDDSARLLEGLVPHNHVVFEVRGATQEVEYVSFNLELAEAWLGQGVCASFVDGS